MGLMLGSAVMAIEPAQPCRSNLEKLSAEQKFVMTGAMGTVNAFLGTPFQHIKNALQNREPIPPAKHLWRGTGLNILRSTPSNLPEVMIMGNADRIIKRAQLPIACDTQKGVLAFAAAAPGTVINTIAEQLVMRRKNGGSCYAITKNIMDTVGAMALLRGFTPKFMRDGIGSFAYWYAAPKLKQEYKKRGATEAAATIAAGLSVALPSTIITHPFDTVSTAMQTDLHKKTYRNTAQSIVAYTRTHGYKSLFEGCTPRLASSVIRIPALLGIQDYITGYFIGIKKTKEFHARN